MLETVIHVTTILSDLCETFIEPTSDQDEDGMYMYTLRPDLQLSLFQGWPAGLKPAGLLQNELAQFVTNER